MPRRPLGIGHYRVDDLPVEVASHHVPHPLDDHHPSVPADRPRRRLAVRQRHEPIAAAVHRGVLDISSADAEADARAPAPAAREASRAQGRGLLRLARKVWPDPDWAELGTRPHLPVVAGRVGSTSGLTPEQTALAIVYTSMTGSAIAAQRLLALDPGDVAALTFGLAETCQSTADLAAVCLADLSDPLLDELAHRHAQRERPMFSS